MYVHAPGARRAPRHHRSRLSRGAVIALAVLLSTTIASGTASASPRPRPPVADSSVISQWNQIAVTTLGGDTTKNQPGNIFLMGMFHAAIYDAVIGIEGRFQPYAFHDRAPRGASAPAAVIAAAHTFLVTYAPYATATLDAARTDALAALPEEGRADGVVFGTKVTANLIKLRTDDGRNAPVTYDKAPGPGVWEPTPPTFTPMLDPWLAVTKPLLIRSATQFAPPPPPALTSAQYTRDYNEVKALGSKTSTERTAEQTTTAKFFSGSLLVQWNAALRDQASVRHLDIVDGARLFAAITMSEADAYVTIWRAKLTYGYWRPVTAINRGDTDGNPDTVADPTWEPLLVTPAYPDYSSGYNALTGTVTGGLEKLYGKRTFTLNLISSAVPDTRHYDSGSTVRADVLGARIWLGIHFRTADEVSRDLSLRLVDWTIDHHFRAARY
jgi:hypothetical protein